MKNEEEMSGGFKLKRLEGPEPERTIAVIQNMAIHPTRGTRILPRSRVKRAWLALRGWELYGK
jgi:hypothetical protein